MGSPNKSLTTLRPDIAESMEDIDLAMDREGFIALRVLPVKEVNKSSGNFGRIRLKDLLQSAKTERAPGSGYNRIKWRFEDFSYVTSEEGQECPIDDRESELYSDYFDSEMVSAELARDVVLREFEKAVAALVFNATTWPAGGALGTTVTTKWDVHATASPTIDVKKAKVKVWEGTGLWPNALICTKLSYLELRECAEVRERIVASGAGRPAKASDITPAMLAEVLDLDEVIVAGSAKNTAAEEATATIASVWDKTMAMVARIAKSDSLKKPALGRIFHWGQDGSRIGTAAETYRDETVRGDVAHSRFDVQPKIIYKECAHLLHAVL